MTKTKKRYKSAYEQLCNTYHGQCQKSLDQDVYLEYNFSTNNAFDESGESYYEKEQVHDFIKDLIFGCDIKDGLWNRIPIIRRELEIDRLINGIKNYLPKTMIKTKKKYKIVCDAISVSMYRKRITDWTRGGEDMWFRDFLHCNHALSYSLTRILKNATMNGSFGVHQECVITLEENLIAKIESIRSIFDI